VIKVDNTKRYNQLAIELLKRIFNGYYKLGARLPSTRELAKQASVNPNTMQRALQFEFPHFEICVSGTSIKSAFSVKGTITTHNSLSFRIYAIL